MFVRIFSATFASFIQVALTTTLTAEVQLLCAVVCFQGTRQPFGLFSLAASMLFVVAHGRAPRN